MKDDSNTTKMLWFIAGASIGASISLLFAPAPGEQTRASILEKSGSGTMLTRGRELFERSRQVMDQAAQMFDAGRKLVDDTAAKVQQA